MQNDMQWNGIQEFLLAKSFQESKVLMHGLEAIRAQPLQGPVSEVLGGQTKFQARKATSAKVIPRKTCFLWTRLLHLLLPCHVTKIILKVDS